MTREGYNAFSLSLSLALAASSLESACAGKVDCEGGDMPICIFGEVTGALRGGRLLNDPSPIGIGIAEDVAGCNGGLEDVDVKASSCIVQTLTGIYSNDRTHNDIPLLGEFAVERKGFPIALIFESKLHLRQAWWSKTRGLWQLRFNCSARAGNGFNYVAQRWSNGNEVQILISPFHYIPV